MTGFKPHTSGIGRDRSINCAATTADAILFKKYHFSISVLVLLPEGLHRARERGLSVRLFRHRGKRRRIPRPLSRLLVPAGQHNSRETTTYLKARSEEPRQTH